MKMKKLNHIKILVVLVVVFLTAGAMAKSASVLLEEGIYAEQTRGDLDEAIEIYTQITEQHQDNERVAARATYQLGMCHLKKGENEDAADYFRKVVANYPEQADLGEQAKEQYAKIYPNKEIVERQVVVVRQAIDPAKLMPADTLIYMELGSPGKQIETLVNMLKGTPLENPFALIGGNKMGNLGAFFNPSMLAEFKKIRGAAISITGVTENNQPFVALIDPGESDVLRGLIMAGLGNIGAPSEPIEGMKTFTFGDEAGAAYDEQVIIIGQPLEQLNWSIKQYKGIITEPSLASENKSFSAIDVKTRQDNAFTLWVDADVIFAKIKEQFGDRGLPQELRTADYFLDFQGIDDLYAQHTIEPEGLLLDVNVNFKEGHKCLAYDLIRTPNISKSAFEAVPPESVAVFSFAMDEISGPSFRRAETTVKRLTGLDIGREIFANIEYVTVFVRCPDSAYEQKADESQLPEIGVIITSHQPEQTREIFRRVLNGIQVATVGFTGEQANGRDEKGEEFILNIDGKQISCRMAGLDKITFLTFGPGAFEASLAALENRESAINSGVFSKVISQMPDGTSKVLMVNIGQAVRLGAMYCPFVNGPRRADAQEAFEQLVQALGSTSMQIRTVEDANRFNLHASIKGLPPVDRIYGPVNYLMQLSQEAKAKARADAARAQAGAVIIKTDKSPVIDGEAEDLWADARKYNLTHFIDSSVNLPNDLFASFKAMWDEENLYVLIDVNDENLVNDSSAAEWWFDDSAEVYIDADNSKSNRYDDNDAQYHFDWDKTNPTMDIHNQHGRKENIEFAMVATETGYRTEIKFPWQTIGTKPSPGTSIGLEVQINDDDNGGPRDTKLAWHDSSDLAWDNPMVFGNAELAGLLGWWEFDETQGTEAKDSSAGERNGVVDGNAKWAQGKTGGAVELDGKSGFVKIPEEKAFDISGEITVCCWVNFSSVLNDYSAIVTKGDSAWRLSTAERDSRLHTSVNDWQRLMIDGTKAIEPGQWHHIAMVYDGRQACVYIDGKIDACKEWTGGIGQNDYEVFIGENAQERGRYFNGLIDDVRIYNYALSKTEIETLSTGQ
jgi:tetratricopeptide (TPR) repeat protein